MMINNSGTRLNNVEINIQIEKGSTATSYEPYQEQILPLNLGNLEFCKIGEYEDSFIHDKTTNKWYLQKKTGKKTLNGTTEGSWFKSGITTGDRFVVDFNEAKSIDAPPLLCSHFLAKQTATFSLNSCYMAKFGDGERLFIDYTSYGTTDLATFKSLLASKTPIIYYPLAEPTKIPITDTTLISQLNAIEKAMSYYEQTNISSTHEEGNAPIIIKASALKDIFKEYNSLEARVEALENA